jgi:predicted nicotinamide N-methyase
VLYCARQGAQKWLQKLTQKEEAGAELRAEMRTEMGTGTVERVYRVDGRADGGIDLILGADVLYDGSMSEDVFLVCQRWQQQGRTLHPAGSS